MMPMTTESVGGKGTSEYGLTRLVMVAGAAVDAVAIVLESLKTSGHFPDGSWLPTAMSIVGTLAIVLAQLGYTRSRTMVKLAEAAPVAVAGVATAVPLAMAAARELTSPPPASPLPTPPVLPPSK